MRETRAGFDRRYDEEMPYYDEQQEFSPRRGERVNDRQQFRDRNVRRDPYDRLPDRNDRSFESERDMRPYGGTGSPGRGDFSDFTESGPRSFRRSDDRIYDEVGDRLTQDPRVDASDINIEVREALVTLTGFVPDREQKRRAEDITESVSGVRDVRNDLRMSEQGRAGYGTPQWDRKTGQRTVVAGAFRDISTAERAIEELRSLGFTRTDISFVTKDRGMQAQGSKGVEGAETKGATTGAVLGGLGGGALGWLLGIGALAIPGVGPVVAGGALATTIAGAAAGALTGGLVGALVGAGIPENEAREYEKFIKEGGVLVTVTCMSDEEKDRAKDVLQRLGAEKVNDFRSRQSDMTSANVGNGHEREYSRR